MLGIGRETTTVDLCSMNLLFTLSEFQTSRHLKCHSCGMRVKKAQMHEGQKGYLIYQPRGQEKAEKHRKSFQGVMS